MMKKQIMISLTLATALTAWAQERQEKWLNEGWQFSRDKVTWQDVRVPHDWAISGPFDKKWDLQTVAIEQNGEKEKTEKSGRSGALPWIGKGHYKRSIYIDQSCSRAELLFDGAMSEPTVYVNGQLAGKWAYGYNAFRVDITPMMRKGENKVEVELNNVEESSRWYPGGGIYRPVKLITTGKVYIDDWSIFAHTTKLEKKMATVEVTAKVMGQLTSKNAGIEIALYDKKGGFVAANRVVPTANGEVKASLDVEKPQLWSPESPYLYQLVTRVYQDNQLIDEVTMPYGVRTVKVSKENGFQLNGVTRKIKGV
ncbi:MAG: beta-galactosidase, partial [Prevotella sp.]|nr:beta-galactosidase [Prevotella sp.]